MPRNYDRFVVRKSNDSALTGNESRDGAAIVQINIRKQVVEMHIGGVNDIDVRKLNGGIAIGVCRRYVKHFCRVAAGMECYFVRKCNVWQAIRAACRGWISLEAFADIVVRNHYSTCISVCGVAANVIAVDVGIDYEVDLSTGDLSNCFDQGRGNGFDAVVDKNNLVVAHQ